MGKSVLELGVDTGKWDAGLKKAKNALDTFVESNGGLNKALDKESEKVKKFVSMMGNISSTATTGKGKLNDYKSTLEQLTMQYNSMSEAQKKAVGDTYIQSIDQLKKKYQEVNEEVKQFNKSLMEGSDSPAKASSGGNIVGAMEVFKGNLMTKAASVAGNFALSMSDAVREGVMLAQAGEGIRIAFEKLNRPDLLDGLRQATHGTVTDIELMKQAVKFNDFNLDIEQMGTLLAFAQQKAKDTGQSVDYMVDSIVTGLGRKSLMILDNLGLSAAEIKERMEESGDMTKAVADIIQDRMAAAGGYVKTAADQAAASSAKVQNKLEEVGRTFQPLTSAGSKAWTDLKIKALDFLQWGITPVIKGLQAIGLLDKSVKAPTVPAVAKKPVDTGKVGGTYQEVTVGGKVVAAYRNGELLFDHRNRGGGGGGSRSYKSSKSLPAATIDPQAAMLAEFMSRESATTTNVQMTRKLIGNAMSNAGGAIDKSFLEIGNGLSEETLKNLNKTKQLGIGIGDAFSLAANAANSLNAAMQGLEDPGARAAGTVIQAIANIALGFGQAAAQAGSLGPWAWLAYVGAGAAALATTISTVHSLTGYAEGGMIPGNSYSGDQLPAMVNSGELILNRAQQGNIASQLQEGGVNRGQLVGRLRGSDIIISVERTLSKQGKGQLVTW